MVFTLFIVFVLSFGACVKLGVDISSFVTKTAFTCLKNDNFTFATVRCYRSNAEVDENCPSTIKNAQQAGIDPVWAYMFPDPKSSKKNASTQVDELMDYLKKNDITLPLIWIDIEGADKFWHKEVEKNREFFTELVDQFKNEWKQDIGIYASHHSWPPIMGLDWDGGVKASEYLWYAHYDDKQTFDDWFDTGKYGGWEKPWMKQYKGTTPLCGAQIDKNWNPNL